MEDIQGEEVLKPFIRIKYKNLPHASAADPPDNPLPKINAESVRPKKGVPVPVRDRMVSPDQTIPTRGDMRDNENFPDKVIGHDGEIEVGKPKLDHEESDPPNFIPAERFPIPVRIEHPAYPEMAIRKRVEGTVWVKIFAYRYGRE